MAERYLPPKVAELVEAAGRRPAAWAEERIRRDARCFYAQSKQARLRELLGAAADPDARRKLTNLASAEASRKKKQFIQERSFAALRRVCAAQRQLARAVAVLVDANERQRKENARIAALLATYTSASVAAVGAGHSPPPPALHMPNAAAVAAAAAAAGESLMHIEPLPPAAASELHMAVRGGEMQQCDVDEDVRFAELAALDAERFLA